MPACSRRAAHCSSNVDFPMPGSPPTSTTDPGTIPPPSTKSNSGRPVRQRCNAPPPTSDSRTGGLSDETVCFLSDRPTARPRGSSTSVFHAPHASQRPPHFGCSAPQSVQRNTEPPPPLRTVEPRRRLARRVVVEARVFLLEEELHGPRGAVALFSDDELCEAFDVVVRLRVGGAVVELLAIDEAHDVGVLLDRARLPQVGELRPAVLAAP